MKRGLSQSGEEGEKKDGKWATYADTHPLSTFFPASNHRNNIKAIAESFLSSSKDLLSQHLISAEKSKFLH